MTQTRTNNNRDLISVRLSPELMEAVKARRTQLGPGATMGQAVRALLFEATGLTAPENLRKVRPE